MNKSCQACKLRPLCNLPKKQVSKCTVSLPETNLVSGKYPADIIGVVSGSIK